MKNIARFFAILLLMPTAVNAATNVSLKEAIVTALEKNHLLRASVYQSKAAERDVASSRSRYLPHIYFDETASYSNLPTRTFMMKLDQGRFTQNDFLINNLNQPDATGDFRSALTLEQAIFDISIGQGKDLASMEQEARQVELERRRQEVAFMVYQTYIEVQKARAHQEVADQALKEAREHQRLANVRRENGVGLVSDELRARTFLSEMEQQNITAYNNLVLARTRLGQVMGGEPGVLYDIKEDVENQAVNIGKEEFLTQARLYRQELLEADKGVDKAVVGVSMAKGSYLPKVYGSASYQMNSRDIPFGRDNDGWIVGANLRWDIFDGLRRESQLEKARLQKSASEEYRENLRREVEYQVTEAYLRRSEAGKRVEVARHSQLDAEEVVRLVTKRFENSLATMVELLDAQTAANRARAQRIENESNLALATARLLHATGIFLKEVMK